MCNKFSLLQKVESASTLSNRKLIVVTKETFAPDATCNVTLHMFVAHITTPLVSNHGGVGITFSTKPMHGPVV